MLKPAAQNLEPKRPSRPWLSAPSRTPVTSHTTRQLPIALQGRAERAARLRTSCVEIRALVVSDGRLEPYAHAPTLERC
jgi:hypothetical protein